jgi:hypothetical protein
MAQPILRVVVLGDSVMWGQGLRDEDKFAFKSAQAIGQLLGRQVDIVINTARSGACIRAGRTEAEAKRKRAEFVATYPSMFKSRKLRDDFIENNIQEVAILLHPENPATFPTISYQVQRVPDEIGRTINLVIIDGGVNDLDFQEFLNPDKHRSNFVRHYDPLIEEYFYLRTRSLLRQAREKFPHAVIVLTGYYTPFAPGVSNGAIKDLFEHESGEAGWLIWLNDNIIELENVDQLVREAQIRSQYAASRGLDWARRVVAEANADPILRGPGILFVNPQFGPGNTVFARNSFMHREYEVSKVKDAAKQIRENNCPRIEHDVEMVNALNLLLEDLFAEDNKGPFTKDDARRLREKLDGPLALLDALRRLEANPANVNNIRDAIAALSADLKRISNVRRASFIHPNEKGAQRYANVIVKRYTERHHRIRLRDDIVKLQKKPGSQPASLKQGLHRFGLPSQSSLRAITQLMLVDSVRVTVDTAEDSAVQMLDDIFLNLGGSNRWQLNFPPHLIPTAKDQVPFTFKKLQPVFEPGSRDVFTFDARGTHLSSITQFTLERRVNPFVAASIDLSLLPLDFSKGIWKPTRITLQLNGIVVFDVPFFSNLSRGSELTFGYPRQ